MSSSAKVKPRYASTSFYRTFNESFAENTVKVFVSKFVLQTWLLIALSHFIAKVR